MKRSGVWGIVAVCMLGIASGAWAQYSGEPINTYGAQCFVYQDYAYVPLRSTGDFIGASTTWDRASNQASVIYGGNGLLLTIGSTTCDYLGRPARLPAPPIVVGDQVMVPAMLFHDFFFVDVDWYAPENRVFIMGPGGWGYYDVSPYAPAYASRAFAGYAPVYVPPPFYYNNLCYVPLYDYCSFFGYPTFFEPDFDDFLIIIGGHEVVLAIGERRCHFGNDIILLPAAPVIVRNTVCVPVNFFQDSHIRAPLRLAGNTVRLQGPGGWRQMRIDPRPPARIMTSLPPQPQRLGIPVRPRTIPNIEVRAPRPEPVRRAAPMGPAAGQPRMGPEVRGRQMQPQGPAPRGRQQAPAQQRVQPRGQGQTRQQAPPQQRVQPRGQGQMRQQAPPQERVQPRQQGGGGGMRGRGGGRRVDPSKAKAGAAQGQKRQQQAPAARGGQKKQRGGGGQVSGHRRTQQGGRARVRGGRGRAGANQRNSGGSSAQSKGQGKSGQSQRKPKDEREK